MKKAVLSSLPVVAALALVLAFTGGAAGAASPSTTYTADLKPVTLNTPDGAATGQVTIKIEGDQATVSEKVSGLADKFPTDTSTLEALGIPTAFAGKPFAHVQHIHIGGQGVCPSAGADANKDGVISTAEGVPAYGSVGTTLSTTGSTAASAATDVAIAPSGGSYTYRRTFTLNQATLKSVEAGTGVIVVHGLNAATAPKASLTSPSSLAVKLPDTNKPLALVGTAPALCGPLKAVATSSDISASQMRAMPTGGVQTGGGSTAGLQDGALLGIATVLITGAGVILIARRRIATQD